MSRFMLVQGDCRKVLPFVKSESIQAVITSPPYFQMVHYSDTQIEGEIGVRGSPEQYVKDLTEVFEQVFRVLKPTGLFMLNLDNSKREKGEITVSAWEFVPILRQIGFNLVGTIIWINRAGKPTYHSHLFDHIYEPIFILSKTNKRNEQYIFNKFNVPEGDVWTVHASYFSDIRKEDEEGVEKPRDLWDGSGFATFPVELIKYLVALGSNEGDTVLDPFCGSGTTMDVSQRLNRNCIGIEIVPMFCENIMKRVFTNPANSYTFKLQGELERSKTDQPT